MRSTNELPRPIARARGAVGRARQRESNVERFIDQRWINHSVAMYEDVSYEWARAAAALLAWGLS